MPLTHILAFIASLLGVLALRELPSALILAVLCVPVLLPWRGRAAFSMFVFGALLAVWQAQAQLTQRWPVERHDEELWIEGQVASLPEHAVAPPRYSRKGELREPAGDIWRFIFEPRDAAAQNVPRRIRAAWYRADATVRGGECWRLRLKLKSPHGSLNPGAFDYEGWLLREGIGATATVRGAQRCEVQAGGVLLRLRQSLAERLRAWLPDDPALGLIAALSIGDTSMINDADWDVFRLTGTTHLVAISGFNIAIAAGCAFWLLRGLWSLIPALCLRVPAQSAGLFAAALAALLYALLAGFGAPVVRALLMLWIVLIAAWLGRLAQPQRALLLAAFLILLFDPFAALAPGFWLSFGAVAAIFYVSAHRYRQPGAMAAALRVQLMLSIALVPLTLLFFHGASWSAPWVNLLAVPLFAVLTPLLLVALMLAGLWPLLGLPLLGGVAAVLAQLRDGLGWIAVQWPQAWIAASPSPAVLLLAGFGILLLFAPRGLPLRLPALLCLAVLAFPPDHAPREGAEVAVLDVGQGLSVVVRTAHHLLLYDAGPAFDEGFDAGESVVAPYLLGRGVSRIDRLMVSHGDNDHSGGVPAVRRLFEIGDERGALTATSCREGEDWEWDGVRFQTLHPDETKWSDNNGSCVLRVSVGTQALLLTGDIEKAAEAHLLRERTSDLRAQVLVAPHHGSKTSSTQEFIEAVDAHTVIFSAGWKHHFHHPHPSVVERFEWSGAALYDTGWSGMLRFTLLPQRVTEVELWRAQAARWWNAPAAQMPPDAD